jgi:hypothetical protein
MSALRKLSAVYLLCASVFSVMVAFDRDPPLEQASRRTVAMGLDAIRGHLIDPAISFGRAQSTNLMQAMFGAPAAKPEARKPVAPTTAMALAPVHIVPPAPVVAPEPSLMMPSAPVIVPPQIRIAPEIRVAKEPLAAPPALRPSLVPPPAMLPVPPSTARLSLAPSELVRVSMRLKDSLTHEMLNNFGLFLYVSKADNGPWAQRLYVFRKDAGGNLTLLYNWPASTGREKIEIAANGTRQPSFTPQGYYELDPGRMYKNHYSGQWHEPMPHAMFFNWEHNGLQTGIAIHGAVGLEIAQLGTRASAGCIRIAPENAALLYKLIRTQYKGLAPVFAIDRRTATMSNDGVMMHDAAGNLEMADGYKVLVFVENYGGNDVVAALF